MRFDVVGVLVLKLGVWVTCHPYLFEIEGLFTEGWRPGQTFGESVGGIFEMDRSHWPNGIRYHIFVTRSDTEFDTPPARVAVARVVVFAGFKGGHVDVVAGVHDVGRDVVVSEGRGLHSFTFQLNLSRV
jgi:hypothetical protein